VAVPGEEETRWLGLFDPKLRLPCGILDHPNIARVLDAGATESGRPFFVMELVRGIPITEYCDKNHLPPRERLELFVSVCHAIQHAHQKGVIHRDIKPSNVLVTSHDGKPVAKVIDFGVAKAIHQPLTERTIYTNFAQMIGTPLYMSPEQAEMSGLDIDTRSDIYSLGVLLYELLTGSTPLAKKRVAAAAYDEIRRLIREEEPPRPSTRLSTSGSLASIAAQRHTEPAKLSKLVRGDLDWITMKALEKDRTRRYETANGLARDIQRYLADEVVEARPPSTAYRLRKFGRKYRAALTTAVALVLFLVTGITASTWLAVRARRAEAAALDAKQAEAERAEGERRANADLAAKNAELAEEQATVEARNKELAAEQAKAQARFEMAMKAIALFHTGVSEDMLLKNPEFERLRTKLLQEAAGFYADLEKLLAGQADAQSRKTLAEGYFQLAELTAKIGDKQQALAVHRQALALRRELAAAPGADVETRLDVARSLRATYLLFAGTGDAAGLRSAVEEQRDLAAALEAEAPTDAVRQQLAFGHNAFGVLLAQTGKLAEGLPEHHKALAIRQKLADANPTVTLFQSDLAQSHSNIGSVLREMGKPEEALTELRKALAIRQKLADANPANTEFQSDLAGSHNNLAYALAQMGKPEEALTEYRKELAINQKLADANPAVTWFQSALAQSLHDTGRMLTNTGMPEAALEPCRKALAIHQKLADAHPAVTWLQRELAWSHIHIGRALSEMEKPEEALTEYHKALAISQKLADANPAITLFQRALAWSHDGIGDLLIQTGKPEEAFTEFRKALAIFQKLADDDPANTDFRNGLSGARQKLAQMLAASGLVKEVLPLLATAAAADPKDTLLSLQVAALQAWFGQDEEFAATREGILGFAKDTKEPTTAERAAKACSILPSTSRAELDAALAFARNGVQLDRDGNLREWMLLALGMAEYRSGNFAAADEALLAAAEAGLNNPWVPGIAAFYRAMSLFRQGHEEAARKLASEAAAQMKPLPQDEQNPLANQATHDDLILWLAYKEAQSLIQFDAPATAPR
jgi:eukaryotic-like serine/threonine-protein kinase